MATRPTLAPQVNPREKNTPEKDVERHKTVPDLSPSVASFSHRLNGKVGLVEGVLLSLIDFMPGLG
jgi:hypothetical protein